MEERRISYARRFVRLLPVLSIGAGSVYDYTTPTDFTGAPFFTAAPLVAAPLYSRRGTVVTGLAAIAVLLGVRIHLGGLPGAEVITELVTVMVVSVLAVLINALVRRSHERLASAREIAEAAQRAALPEPAERIGGFQIAARYEAAQEGASIGGDLYAVQDSPHGVRVVVGDVRGKGMGAVGLVAVAIGAFREAAEQEATLEAVAMGVPPGSSGAESLGEAGAGAGARAYAARGGRVLRGVHHRRTRRAAARQRDRAPRQPRAPTAPAAVRRRHRALTVRSLTAAEPALPLGMAELGAWPDRAEEAGFRSGSTLLLYTDGLSEARDEEGRFYDPEAGLAGRANAQREPAALLGVLASEVRRHSGGGMADDMALIAVRRP